MDLSVSIASTKEDIATCMQLRWDVFVKEQGVSEEEEVDGEDDRCTHVLAKLNDVPVGAARFQYVDDYAKIQRVCVPKKHRGIGLGAHLINFTVDEIKKAGKTKSIRLGAQTHALDFYRGLGFSEVGEEYLDANIPHKDMVMSV